MLLYYTSYSTCGQYRDMDVLTWRAGWLFVNVVFEHKLIFWYLIKHNLLYITALLATMLIITGMMNNVLAIYIGYADGGNRQHFLEFVLPESFGERRSWIDSLSDSILGIMFAIMITADDVLNTALLTTKSYDTLTYLPPILPLPFFVFIWSCSLKCL